MGTSPEIAALERIKSTAQLLNEWQGVMIPEFVHTAGLLVERLLAVAEAAREYRNISTEVLSHTVAGVTLQLANSHGDARRKLDAALDGLSDSYFTPTTSEGE